MVKENCLPKTTTFSAWSAIKNFGGQTCPNAPNHHDTGHETYLIIFKRWCYGLRDRSIHICDKLHVPPVFVWWLSLGCCTSAWTRVVFFSYFAVQWFGVVPYILPPLLGYFDCEHRSCIIIQLCIVESLCIVIQVLEKYIYRGHTASADKCFRYQADERKLVYYWSKKLSWI